MINESQRAEYEAVFAESKRRAREISGPLSDAQFNWKPPPDRWSVAECIEHLNIVARRYVPAMTAAIGASAKRAEGPYGYGWLSNKFIAAVRPGSRPVRTAKSMKPAGASGGFSSLDKANTLAEFEKLTDAYIRIVRASEGVDLAATKMRSPFLWLLRLPVGAFMEAMGLHALRHLDQAEKVTTTEGFPAE